MAETCNECKPDSEYYAVELCVVHRYAVEMKEVLERMERKWHKSMGVDGKERIEGCPACDARDVLAKVKGQQQ